MSRRDRLVGVIQTAPPGVHAFSSFACSCRKRFKGCAVLPLPGGAANDFQTTAHSTGPLANLNCNIPSEGRQLIRIRQALRAGIGWPKDPILPKLRMPPKLACVA